MIATRQIRVGAIIEVTVRDGEVFQNRIIDILNGKVILVAFRSEVSNPVRNSRGRWWLPIEFVKQHARLLSEPSRVGDLRRSLSAKSGKADVDNGRAPNPSNLSTKKQVRNPEKRRGRRAEKRWT